MHWMNGVWGGGLMMLLWWGLLITGVIAVSKWRIEQRAHPSAVESPLEILKRRYARGEITKEEFESHKKHIL